MDGSSTPATEALLRHDDINAGLGLVQTVYGVGMALGLKNVLETSYGVFFLPASSSSETLPLSVILLAFVAVILLAIRFFWVPRNLSSFIVRPHDEEKDDLFRKITIFHVPITLAHAVLFFFVCHAFVEMASPSNDVGHPTGAELAVRFVAIYAALLFVNALWLYWITPSSDPEPGRIWARSNLCTAFGTGVALAVFGIGEFPNFALVVAACTMFLVNSAWDLLKTAKYYILFETSSLTSSTVPDPNVVAQDG